METDSGIFRVLNAYFVLGYRKASQKQKKGQKKGNEWSFSNAGSGWH